MGRENEGFYTLFLYVTIHVVDFAFLTLIVVVLFPLLLFLFRKRLLTALTRLVLQNGLESVDILLFEEVLGEVDGKKVKQKVLTPFARGFLAQAAPILVEAGIKAVPFKVPANLPVNPKTGELDFMAPVLQKLASGKKVKLDDFLPLILDKAMPYVEGFLGKMGQPTSSPGTAVTKNPFLKEP